MCSKSKYGIQYYNKKGIAHAIYDGKVYQQVHRMSNFVDIKEVGNIHKICLPQNIQRMTINLVIAVGSVDGILTSAAAIRHIAPDADVIFTQAFKVDMLPIYDWEEDRRILFVDLAVNNRDSSMTVACLKKVTEKGHEIIGVLDEHNAQDWQEAFDHAGLDYEELAIKPVTQNNCEIKSSGALFLSLFPDVDDHTRELCIAADCGDKMDFSTYGNIVNASVKSYIADDSRRVYLAKHFAKHQDSDITISGWMGEYQRILDNNDSIIEDLIDLGSGIVKINATGKVVDMTSLMKSIYDLGYLVVITLGEMFDKALGKKTVQLSFGCKPGLNWLDMVDILKSKGINASGFSAKANISLEDEELAIQAVREALSNCK